MMNALEKILLTLALIGVVAFCPLSDRYFDKNYGEIANVR